MFKALLQLLLINHELRTKNAELESLCETYRIQINEMQEGISALQTKAFDVRYGESPEEIIEEIVFELPVNVRRILEEEGVDLIQEVKRLYGDEGDQDYPGDYSED